MKTTLIVSVLALALLIAGYLLRPRETPDTEVAPTAAETMSSGENSMEGDGASAELPEGDTPAEIPEGGDGTAAPAEEVESEPAEEPN